QALCRIAQGSEIGDQPDAPEQERNREVCGNRENVPDQRAAKLRPYPHTVGIGEEPVDRQPGTSGVDQGEQAGLHHREDGHGFGEAFDGRTPTLLEEKQDGRDQSSGVADTDPPDEVDDGESPADGNVDAPDPGAAREQVANCRVQHAEDSYGYG